VFANSGGHYAIFPGILPPSSETIPLYGQSPAGDTNSNIKAIEFSKEVENTGQ